LPPSSDIFDHMIGSIHCDTSYQSLDLVHYVTL